VNKSQINANKHYFENSSCTEPCVVHGGGGVPSGSIFK
jgi:hypothetical protein